MIILTISLKTQGSKIPSHEKDIQLEDKIAYEIYQGVKRYIDRKLADQYKMEKIRNE